METPYLTPTDPLVAELADRLDQNQREDFEERAGIVQFDAGLPRGHAEALAMLDVLCRYPEALTGISVLKMELDGGTQWLLTTDLSFARRYLADVGGSEIAQCNLAEVVAEQYGGITVLSMLG
jgi:hypothetical protein